MTQTRMVIGTLNNPTVDPKDYLEGWSKVDGVVFVTGQLEKGKEGTPHVQYFVQTKDQKRAGFFKAHCSKSHFEFVKFNNGADEYCNKEESRLDGPWSFGIRPAKRNVKGDVKRRNAQILEMGVPEAVRQGIVPIEKYRSVKQSVELYKLDVEPAYEAPDVRGVWIYGPPGVGKSTFARKEYPGAYRKAQNKWFDGYQGQHAIILDDYDCRKAGLGHKLKIWTDSFPCDGEVKGGCVPLHHRVFVITSNYTPEEVCPEDPVMAEAIRRRCKMIHMSTMKKEMGFE